MSAYKKLLCKDEVAVIGFPQAIDPRENRNARELLLRDVVNVCDYFAAYGVCFDGAAHADRLRREYAQARRYSFA